MLVLLEDMTFVVSSSISGKDLARFRLDDSLLEEDRMPAIFREFFSENDFYFSQLINSFLNTYLLALGEFDFEDFNTRGPFSQTLLWILFLFFTFMLQITFVNMVIAIMSKTFDNVTDAQYQSSITERIALLNDFSIFLDFFKLDIDAQFLFLVYPSSKDFVTNTVEEKLDEIAGRMEGQQNLIIESIAQNRQLTDSRFQQVEDEIHENKEQIMKIEQQINTKIEEMT